MDNTPSEMECAICFAPRQVNDEALVVFKETLELFARWGTVTSIPCTFTHVTRGGRPSCASVRVCEAGFGGG